MDFLTLTLAAFLGTISGIIFLSGVLWMLGMKNDQ